MGVLWKWSRGYANFHSSFAFLHRVDIARYGDGCFWAVAVSEPGWAGFFFGGEKAGGESHAKRRAADACTGNASGSPRGQSVCRNRWVEIRNQAGKSCYAQWSDCGPGGADDWQYVFGNELPEHRFGLGVSPAVRDYLGLGEMNVTSWRFMDQPDVPSGPWSQYGEK